MVCPADSLLFGGGGVADTMSGDSSAVGYHLIGRGAVLQLWHDIATAAKMLSIIGLKCESS